MDFIERTFGISPDGGSGAMEVALILFLLLIVTFLMRFFQTRIDRLGDAFQQRAHTVRYSFSVGRTTHKRS
jgi:hypothetical protein